MARTCSLIFIVLDVLKPLQHKKLIEHELEGFGIRLNKTPPNIGFRKKDKGGLNLTLQVRGMEEHFHPYQPPTVITLPLLSPSHSHRFPSHSWTWHKCGASLQSTVSTMLILPCAVTQRLMTSLTSLRETGQCVESSNKLSTNGHVIFSPCFIPQSLYSVYLCTQQD